MCIFAILVHPFFTAKIGHFLFLPVGWKDLDLFTAEEWFVDLQKAGGALKSTERGPEMGIKLEQINSGAIPNSLKASAYLP